MEFVHLHNHTDFSLLDGAASITNYVKKAVSLGMKSLAITDHGNMFGVLYFYDECRKNGIKPLIGCEFYVNPKDRRSKESGNKYYHLILIAQSDKGYHNLMELNSIAYKEGFYYKPRIDDESLEKHSEDLICTSACLAGELLQILMGPQAKGSREFIKPSPMEEKIYYEKAKERALWFKNLFKDRYYIELQDHGLAEQKYTNPILVRLAKELDIPVIATNDIHYIEKEDANAQDTLLCIGTNSKKNEENRMRFPCDEFYFKTQEEMAELFSWCPEAIENTNEVASKCDIKIAFPGPVLPKCDIPEEFSSEAEYLRHLANVGLEKRYGTVTKELQERLDYELSIIEKMNFPGYFLIVRDYIVWAKDHGIPVGPGRGSGAGSLVAYSVNITDIDPIKYSLLFERFLNPERVSMPDFDVDFCFERRGEVIDYVTEHYGKEKVGQIVTFGTLKAKMVVKDVARVLDIPYDEANKICSLIPDEPKMTVKKALEEEEKLRKYYEEGGIYKELFDTSEKLEGFHRHTSLHAAGVVIGRENLEKYVPLMTDPKTGGVATQYTMKQIEQCGLVKMDFLGLKTLTLIKHTVDLIRKRNPEFDISKIDEKDEKTFKMLSNGDSSCVFQFESAGMRRILKRAQPSEIEDLVSLNALYRPGPMQFIDQYIDCKLGVRKIEYPHPDLENVLKTTYGVIVYQEQVMQVAQIIAGYTLGEADILRRIMGKKQQEKLAEEIVKFRAGAVKRGYSAEDADRIFHILEPFAGYGFNKSHAVAYSVVAYQTAYLKANYPAEFLAANLTNEMGSPDKFREYLNLAPQMNLKVLPPSINASDVHFTVVDGDIIYGLAGIKNVGESVVRIIIQERDKNGPYASFMNFLERMPESMNSRLLESLIASGCFDQLGENRATLLENLEKAIEYDKSNREMRRGGQMTLFGGEDEVMNSFEMRSVPDFSQEEKVKTEKELLGFYISGHPLDRYEEKIKEAVRVNLSDPTSIPFGVRTQFIALVSTMKTIKSKSGQKMASFTLQTKDGECDAVLFPKQYAIIGEKIEEDRVYAFKGVFNSRDDKLSFTINDICQPEDLEPEYISKIVIKLNDSEICTSGRLEELESTMGEARGDIPVTLELENENVGIKLSYDYFLAYSNEIVGKLKELPVVRGVLVC